MTATLGAAKPPVHGFDFNSKLYNIGADEFGRLRSAAQEAGSKPAALHQLYNTLAIGAPNLSVDTLYYIASTLKRTCDLEQLQLYLPQGSNPFAWNNLTTCHSQEIINLESVEYRYALQHALTYYKNVHSHPIAHISRRRLFGYHWFTNKLIGEAIDMRQLPVNFENYVPPVQTKWSLELDNKTGVFNIFVANDEMRLDEFSNTLDEGMEHMDSGHEELELMAGQNLINHYMRVGFPWHALNAVAAGYSYRFIELSSPYASNGDYTAFKAIKIEPDKAQRNFNESMGCNYNRFLQGFKGYYHQQHLEALINYWSNPPDDRAYGAPTHWFGTTPVNDAMMHCDVYVPTRYPILKPKTESEDAQLSDSWPLLLIESQDND